jgi:hypothetical protein
MFWACDATVSPKNMTISAKNAVYLRISLSVKNKVQKYKKESLFGTISKKNDWVCAKATG